MTVIIDARKQNGTQSENIPVRVEWPRFGSREVARYGALGLENEERPNIVPSSPVATAKKSRDGSRDIFEIERSEPLELVTALSHHLVDEDHLWIAVEDGKVIVADSTDDEIMQRLIRRQSPIEAALSLTESRGLSEAHAWSVTLRFIGRLAAAGMIVGIRGYHAIKRVRPESFARFHLTQRCQLECIHCYTDSGPHLSSKNELPVERWLDLVGAFADNGGEKILFTGGEALVYRGCFDVMRRAHERGLEVTLFSNGILVPRYIDEIKSAVDIVQISLDGPDETSHDAVRGKGSFRKAMKAIHLLLDRHIETRVSTTIMMNNWQAIQTGLPKLIAEFENTPLSFRVSYGAMPHGRGTNLAPGPSAAEVRLFVDDLLSRVKTTEDRDSGPNVVQKITGCGYAEQLVVAPDGQVYGCHLMSGSLGHVDQMSVSDITRYLRRTADAFSVNNRLGCSSCDLRNLCGGSCRVEDEKHTGSRLITTCTPEDKIRKKRFLVRRYRPTVTETPS